MNATDFMNGTGHPFIYHATLVFVLIPLACFAVWKLWDGILERRNNSVRSAYGAAMTFEDAKSMLIVNADNPNDYDRLTTWEELREAADAELLQGTYHLNQLAELVSIVDERCSGVLIRQADSEDKQ